jgi:hypothetical protein
MRSDGLETARRYSDEQLRLPFNHLFGPIPITDAKPK